MNIIQPDACSIESLGLKIIFLLIEEIEINNTERVFEIVLQISNS